jgi:hypothetical protein
VHENLPRRFTVLESSLGRFLDSFMPAVSGWVNGTVVWVASLLVPAIFWSLGLRVRLNRSDRRLQVRVFRKVGWIHGDEDLGALGIPEARDEH